MKDDTVQLLILTVILILYMLIGAAIFTALELEDEKKREIAYEDLFSSLEKKNNISRQLMAKFRLAHEEACLLGFAEDGIKRWDYAGSFYFAGTVITTIGFGLTAPSTFNGQLFFLFYAMFGIPLNILFLNTALERIVTLMARLIRAISHQIPKNKIIKPIGPREFPAGCVLFSTFWILAMTIFVLAGIFSYLENWNLFEAIYFVVVACTTVGFGDYVPSKLKTRVGHNAHKGYIVGNWFLIGFGVVIVYVVLNLVANYMKKTLRYLISKYKRILCPCLLNAIDPLEPKDGKWNERVSRASSRVSMASEASVIDVGSFAAIQTALERMKKRADISSSEGSSELKALSTIETLLRNEFKKSRERQGSSVKAKWRRAAAKARRYHRQELRRMNVSKEVQSNNNTEIELGVSYNNYSFNEHDDMSSYVSMKRTDSQNNNIARTSNGEAVPNQPKINQTGDLEVTEF